MGANPSKNRYEYEYGQPAYDPYARSRAMGFAQGAPFFGQPTGMVQPGFLPPTMIYPIPIQPLQQISGPPVGQVQQFAPQPQMQQQPVIQIPQPQMQPGIPQNLVPPLPIPQMPQPDIQPGFQPQPQPQYALSPGAPAMPEPSVQQGPGVAGAMPVIPRSFTRAPSRSSSGSGSSAPRRRRRSIDPMERNPLPVPPRELEIPDDLLAGTAMAPRGPPLPRPSSPLKNPLPPPPRDVYTLRKYRPLLYGEDYADRRREVFPRGWFSDDDKSESGLGRVLERLNPFRSPSRDFDFSPRHRRSETMPVLANVSEFVRENSETESENNDASPTARRFGLGRVFSSRIPFGRRTRGAERMMPTPDPGQLPPLADGQGPPAGFMPMPSPVVPGPTDQPQPAHPLSPTPGQPQPANPLNPLLQPDNPLTPGPPQPQPINPFTPGPPQPQPGSMLTPGPPQPQPGNMLTPGPLQPMQMPTPAHSLSPMFPQVVAGEGPRSPGSNSDSTLPLIRFDSNTPGYGGLTHTSPHRVLYQRKLYPTAAHLFEAMRFLGRRNDLAARVRKAGPTLPELCAVLSTITEHTRPDWEEILIDKMEEALYYKIVQHGDLCDILLSTGVAELIYTEPSDPFWGEGEHEEGANELGRALMRIRDQLKREDEEHRR